MANFIPENIQTLLSKFTFDVDHDYIIEDLTCIICKKLLRDAYQSTCECKYCRRCIVPYMNDGNEYCPGDKEECQEELLVLDRSVFPNAAINKKVLKVNVCCPNESCQFTSALTQMEDHLRVCSYQPMECPYTKIGCTIVRVNRSVVETHLNKDTLVHSQMLMKVVDNLKKEVEGLNDGLRANKLNISSLREECKLKEMEIREDERRKYQEEIGSFIAMEENLKSELALLREQMECSESEVEALKMEIGTERKESRKMRDQIEILLEYVKSIYDDAVRFEKDGTRKKETEEETDEIIDRRVDELTKVVNCLNMTINKGVAVGSLLFTVNGFDDLMKKGGTIDSPHLYSHINGYKLQVRVDTCIYLCVSSVICMGEYDDVLSWPASGLSVSVSLIYQHTKKAYETVTIKYEDRYCSQPIDKNNEPYIRYKLVDFSTLLSTTGLIVSDSILLLVTARPPDHSLH